MAFHFTYTHMNLMNKQETAKMNSEYPGHGYRNPHVFLLISYSRLLHKLLRCLLQTGKQDVDIVLGCHIPIRQGHRGEWSSGSQVVIYRICYLYEDDHSQSAYFNFCFQVLTSGFTFPSTGWALVVSQRVLNSLDSSQSLQKLFLIHQFLSSVTAVQ